MQTLTNMVSTILENFNFICELKGYLLGFYFYLSYL